MDQENLTTVDKHSKKLLNTKIERNKMQLALILLTKDLPSYNYCISFGFGYLKIYNNIALPEIKVKIYEDINILIKNKPDIVGIMSATEEFEMAKEYEKFLIKNKNKALIWDIPDHRICRR